MWPDSTETLELLIRAEGGESTAVNELMERPFTEDDIAHRKEALRFYSNKFHASVIGGLL